MSAKCLTGEEGEDYEMLHIFMNIGILVIFLIFLRFLGVFSSSETPPAPEETKAAPLPRKQLSYEQKERAFLRKQSRLKRFKEECQ